MQKSKTCCVYIGEAIFEFNIKDAIEKYFSPIRGSDIPYPIIIGKTYVYMLSDKIYIEKSKFPKMTDKLWQDMIDSYIYDGYNNYTPLRNETKAIRIKNTMQ